MMHTEYHDIDSVRAAIVAGETFSDAVFQGLDLTTVEDDIRRTDVEGAVFLGCRTSPETTQSLVARGALVFPRLKGLPFNPYRPALYRSDELFGGFDHSDPCTYCDTLDARIYRHWVDTGRDRPWSVIESLARRLHDHAVTDALEEIIRHRSPENVVGIMGGHGMGRDEAMYREVARIARTLAGSGKLVVTGGGPGAMEAAHLGVHFCERDENELDEAISVLAQAPLYSDREWLAMAFRVLERFPVRPGQPESIGIPTWHYGHEPPTPFASQIAKYFANSVREDGLITIAVGGILFSPGSAGTIQELFQDATQNHYVTTGWISPMILFGRDYWTNVKPVYAGFRALADPEPYGEFVTLLDTHDEVIDFLQTHSPRQVETSGFVYCDEFCGEREKRT